MSYSAEIVVAGSTYSYPNGPKLKGFEIFFRPDEIVFHLGTSRDKTVPPAHLRNYDAKIYRDGALTETVHVEVTWWASEWLYEIKPDTILHYPGDLIENRLAPPIGNVGMRVDMMPAAKFSGPGGVTSTMTPYEPTTGDRAELSIVNEWAADFLYNGDGKNLLEVAKSNRPIGVWWRDESDGFKCFDLVRYPLANSYWTHYNDPWMGPWPAENSVWTPDGAHMAENAYIAFIATRKLRHLEALQFRVTQAFMENVYWNGTAGGAVCAPDQTRKTAWVIRSLAMCRRATALAASEGALPSYLRGEDHWKQLLDDQFAWFRQTYYAVPAVQRFGAYPVLPTPGWWQQDYMAAAFFFAALWWPEDYGDDYLFALNSTVARTTHKSGWKPCYPTWYYSALGPTLDNNDPSPPDPVNDNDYFQSFGQLWDNFTHWQLTGTDPTGNNGQLTQAQVDAANADPYNGDRYIAPSAYCFYTRGALALAVYLDREGILDVTAEYPDLEQCYAHQDAMMRHWLDTQSFGLAARWAVSVDPQPPVPPDPEEIVTTFNLDAIGASIQLDLVLLDDANHPARLNGEPEYSTDAPSVFSLVPNAEGVLVTALAEGTGKILMNGEGAVTLTAESDGTVTVVPDVPLATKAALVPRAAKKWRTSRLTKYEA